MRFWHVCLTLKILPDQLQQMISFSGITIRGTHGAYSMECFLRLARKVFQSSGEVDRYSRFYFLRIFWPGIHFMNFNRGLFEFAPGLRPFSGMFLNIMFDDAKRAFGCVERVFCFQCCKGITTYCHNHCKPRPADEH